MIMSVHLTLFYLVGVAATLIISGGVYFFSHKKQHEVSRWFLWLLIVASGYIFFAQYFKYQSLHMYADFGHWMQVLQSISAKGWPEVLSHEFIFPGTLNYFAAHFVPFIYIFAGVFKLVTRPETLIVLNFVFMLSSAIPLYKLAVIQGGSRRFGLFMAVLLLWYPTFQYITMYEFEMLRFSIPILLWMLYFWEKQNIKWYFLFILAAILVREEVGLTVAMFGVYLFLFAKARKIGFATFVAGLASFLIIFRIVMPAFSNAVQFEHIGSGIAPQFGNTLTEVVYGVIRHPIEFLSTVLQPMKIGNVVMLLIPFLFLPLLAPAALVGALFNLGIGLLSSSYVHSSYMLYYISPSIPFIFYALLKAWPKVTARFNSVAALQAVLAAVLVSNVFFGPSPISLQFWFKNIRPAPFRTQDFHWSAYRVTAHHQKVEKFVRLIPDNAIISAPQFLYPRLYKKRGTLVFPAIASKDERWHAEYALLDITNNGLKSQSPAFVSEEDMVVVRNNQEWKQVAKEDGYELYRRMEPNSE